MEVLHAHCCGIDVHAKFLVACCRHIGPTGHEYHVARAQDDRESLSEQLFDVRLGTQFPTVGPRSRLQLVSTVMDFGNELQLGPAALFPLDGDSELAPCTGEALQCRVLRSMIGEQVKCQLIVWCVVELDFPFIARAAVEASPHPT